LVGKSDGEVGNREIVCVGAAAVSQKEMKMQREDEIIASSKWIG
jgi:hypothetical protein